MASEGNKCYVTARGTLTKVALEHVRRASPTEQLASGEWDSMVQEVLDAANRDQEWELVETQPRREADDEELAPTPAKDDGPGLSEQQAHVEPSGPHLQSPSSWLQEGHNDNRGDGLSQEANFYDGAGLSEQQAHLELGGSNFGDSLNFGEKLRRAMYRRRHPVVLTCLR